MQELQTEYPMCTIVENKFVQKFLLEKAVERLYSEFTDYDKPIDNLDLMEAVYELKQELKLDARS